MNIYLLRHGACEPLTPGVDDAERRLTPEGRKTVEASLPGMRKLTGQVEFIVTSPYARAMETSEIVAEYFKCRRFVESAAELAGPGNEKKIASKLDKLIGKEHVVVVGHMPNLADLAAFLCGPSLDKPVDLKKGGMAKIHFKGFIEKGQGMLRWVMTPEELARSGANG